MKDEYWNRLPKEVVHASLCMGKNPTRTHGTAGSGAAPWAGGWEEGVDSQEDGIDCIPWQLWATASFFACLAYQKGTSARKGSGGTTKTNEAHKQGCCRGTSPLPLPASPSAPAHQPQSQHASCQKQKQISWTTGTRKATVRANAVTLKDWFLLCW